MRIERTVDRQFFFSSYKKDCAIVTGKENRYEIEEFSEAQTASPVPWNRQHGLLCCSVGTKKLEWQL